MNLFEFFVEQIIAMLKISELFQIGRYSESQFLRMHSFTPEACAR